MKLSNMTANEHDEPTITITLTGAHEIYRSATTQHNQANHPAKD